jgi:16S rRNA (guanine527-N7)-methyltransferase
MPCEHLDIRDTQAWRMFIESERLTQDASDKFKHYMEMLIEWNQKMNLTAITNQEDIINYHFKDSLALGHAIDLSTIKVLADVGTGAGFPGIALKIAYPHMRVILIEVVQKKVRFLNAVIEELGLTDIEVVPLDWLTFLRSTKYPVDLVCARASLAPELLVAMFAPWSAYKKASLAYWAATSWEQSKEISMLFEKKVPYTVGTKNRDIVFFKKFPKKPKH